MVIASASYKIAGTLVSGVEGPSGAGLRTEFSIKA